MTLDDAIEQIKIATRQLARRQTKWFRRWSHVKSLDGQRPIEELTGEVVAAMQSGGDPLHSPAAK